MAVDGVDRSSVEDVLAADGAHALEAQYVHRVYDDIAAHFSETRYKRAWQPWPVVDEYLRALPAGAVVADVGCGNGKYMAVNPAVTVVGCDRSRNLAAIAAGRGFHVVQCDNLALPFRTAAFPRAARPGAGWAQDHALSIAVLHHLATAARRSQAVQEITRILRPGGTALFYVWALEQEGRTFVAQDSFVPWNLQARYTGTRRFYHVFAKGELEELLEQAGGLDLVRTGYDRDNWYAVGRKRPSR